jgi:3-dehydroquinate synthase
MQKITVKLQKRSYDVIIEENLINNIDKYLSNLKLGKKIFIISDDNVAPLYLKNITFSLQKLEHEIHSFTLNAGEHLKSFANLADLANKILSLTPDRNSTIIALGGGVIGDLSGFLASIILRGVNFIQIPTTLLSQIDSSVGGKTAINSDYGKNLLGSFYQPRIVLIDPKTLATLSQREFLCGYVETFKYALINNTDFFALLENNKLAIKNREYDFLTKIIAIAVKSKADIVAQDEKETSGLRALLNLGHTFGHALEKDTNYSNLLKHGEAVAIGMNLAAQFSVKLGFAQPEIIDKIKQHLKYFNIPTELNDIKHQWNQDKLLTHMLSDKKNQDGIINFILLTDIGKAFLAKDIKYDNVVAFLKTLF